MLLKRGVISSLGCFVLLVAIFCIPLSTYAAPRVISSKQPWCKKCKLTVFHAKGKCSGGGTIGMDPVHYNLFSRGNDVYAKGTGFNAPAPGYLVDIYVFDDRDWTLGDTFGPTHPGDPQDVSDGVETILVGSSGIINCERVWRKPLTGGPYDILVDANQDGTYDTGDAVDGEDDIGFKVK